MPVPTIQTRGQSQAASNSYFGTIVSEWAAGSRTEAEQQLVSALVASGNNGFAVKYHMDYTRVLEDAIQKKVLNDVSKVFKYTGSISISGVANGTNLYDALDALSGDLQVGSWIKVFGSAPSDFTYTVGRAVDTPSTPFNLQGGDALIVSSMDPFRVDVVPDSQSTIKGDSEEAHPTEAGVTQSSIAVTQGANGDYVLKVSDAYKASVNTAISSAITTSEATQATTNTTLTTRIADEETARASADTTLQNNINSEASSRAIAISEVTTSISNEVTRATAAEGVLLTDLNAEVTRATAAEGVLTTNLAAEVTRATAAEGVLTTNLSNEIANRIAADTTLSGQITSEASRATAAEGALGTRIDGENTRAVAAESALTTAVAAEATTARAAELVLTNDLAAEVSRASAAEATLTGDLAAEVARAQAAEGVLTAAVTAETAARGTAITGVDNKIVQVKDALNLLITAATDRLDILEAFVVQTEQFVEMSSGGTVLDFSGSLAALASAYPPAVAFV